MKNFRSIYLAILAAFLTTAVVWWSVVGVRQHLAQKQRDEQDLENAKAELAKSQWYAEKARREYANWKQK